MVQNWYFRRTINYNCASLMTISKFEADYCMKVILCNNAIMQRKTRQIFIVSFFPFFIYFRLLLPCMQIYGCKSVWIYCLNSFHTACEQ